MTKWAIVAAGVVAASIAVSDDGRAGQPGDAVEPLLLADLAPLDSRDLGNQVARGVGLEMPLPLGPGGEIGVILWDELKQGRPPAPQPRNSGQGQGQSSVRAVSR